MQWLLNLYLMHSYQSFCLRALKKSTSLTKQLVVIAQLFAALVLVFSTSTHALSLNTPKDLTRPVSSAPIDFPPAVHNTPYKMVAELSFQSPSSKFTYAQEHADQYAAYWPASHPEKKVNGVVVFIHGGCWLRAFDISHSYAFATGLAQAGFHVWSIEYRRAGNGGEWPIALEDAALGLEHISTLNDLGVDISKISILGHSAGGHLAAMLAAQLDDVLPAEIKQVNVIGLAAIMDVVKYAQGDNTCETATPSFMQGMPAQQPIAYYLANPQNFAVLSKRLGKFKLLQGDADAIVDPEQASHQNATTVKLQGAGHFDWIHPGSDAFKQMLLHLSSGEAKP